MRLYGEAATIKIDLEQETAPRHLMFYGLAPMAAMSFAAFDSEFDVEPMLGALKLDNPVEIFFWVTAVAGGVQSAPSEPVSKILTLRKKAVPEPDLPPAPNEPQRPARPVIKSVEVRIPIQADDDKNQYEVEVSDP